MPGAPGPSPLGTGIKAAGGWHKSSFALCIRARLPRLPVDNLVAAAAVDGVAASAPGNQERQPMQQEPDGDALVLVDPNQNEEARTSTATTIEIIRLSAE